MTLRLGKRPATSDRRDFRYGAVRATINLPPAPAPGGGYGMDFGAAGWEMLGNGPDDTVFPGFTGCGDCAWAGPAHETMEACQNAGQPVPAFTGKTIVDQYAAYSGFNPQTGANDTGSDVRDVLTWRQSKGLLDDAGTAHTIGAYVALDPTDAAQLWEALWLFGVIGIGINFPGSAMTQTNADQVWSVVPGATVEGGHYIPIVGHPSADIWTCITWGKRQTMTTEFLQTYCDEAWAWVDPARYQTLTGNTIQGFTPTQVQQYLTAVGQMQANQQGQT